MAQAVEALRTSGGRRAIRALYPNHVPELGFGSELRANRWFELATPTSNVTEIWPVQPEPFRVSVCAACTLNATGQSRVTLSLRQEQLRASCGSRQEGKGP